MTALYVCSRVSAFVIPSSLLADERSIRPNHAKGPEVAELYAVGEATDEGVGRSMDATWDEAMAAAWDAQHGAMACSMDAMAAKGRKYNGNGRSMGAWAMQQWINAWDAAMDKQIMILIQLMKPMTASTDTTAPPHRLAWHHAGTTAR